MRVRVVAEVKRTQTAAFEQLLTARCGLLYACYAITTPALLGHSLAPAPFYYGALPLPFPGEEREIPYCLHPRRRPPCRRRASPQLPQGTLTLTLTSPYPHPHPHPPQWRVSFISGDVSRCRHEAPLQLPPRSQFPLPPPHVTLILTLTLPSLLPLLLQWRVSFVSGDVHLAAAGRLYSFPKITHLASDPHYMPQFVSSAIVNAPPPDILVKV